MKINIFRQNFKLHNKAIITQKVYSTLDELPKDVDEWINDYNNERSHSGKFCYGKTPIQTFMRHI